MKIGDKVRRNLAPEYTLSTVIGEVIESENSKGQIRVKWIQQGNRTWINPNKLILV
jgi:hypothetical protein